MYVKTYYQRGAQYSNGTTRDPVAHILGEASQPCSDADISRIFGVPQGTGRFKLQGFDSAFDGRKGERFRDMIVSVANEFGIHPAFLAANALAEDDSRDDWLRLSPGGIDNIEAGLDFWDEFRRTIKGQLGLTFKTTIRPLTDPRCTDVGGECHFIRREKKKKSGEIEATDTGRIHRFATGEDGLRAMAAYLSVLEGKLIRALAMPQRLPSGLMTKIPGIFGWIAIPEPLQWALMRISYNTGLTPGLAQRTAKAVDKGRDPLKNFPLKGPVFDSEGNPCCARRRAIHHVAKALHLANTVLAGAARSDAADWQPPPCPTTPP